MSGPIESRCIDEVSDRVASGMYDYSERTRGLPFSVTPEYLVRSLASAATSHL